MVPHATEITLSSRGKSDSNMRCLEWPTQSPDLNLFEHFLTDPGEAVRNARCHNLNELQQALVNECSQKVSTTNTKHANGTRAVIQPRGG